MANQTMPFEYFIGLRYTHAKRRNHFISFISRTSMVGIALGVASLIIVLSVMNGFQKELKARILGLTSHLQITNDQQKIENWQSLQQTINSSEKDIVGSAPFIFAQGMLSHDSQVQGVVVRGILPDYEAKVSDLAGQMKLGSVENLSAGKFGIILGTDLANHLSVKLDDKITLLAPQGLFTPTGIVPRIKQFTVVGLFQAGMYEYDAGLAFIHLRDAQTLYRLGEGVSGLRVKLSDVFLADRIARSLEKTLGHTPQLYYVSSWIDEHANFFKAVQMEKQVMFIILALIVAVAAFNIVSTLVMAVTDKRGDIAVLRTLGASTKSIMAIFMLQGSMIGLWGTLFGVIFGILIALNIDVIIPFLEQLFHIQFLAKDVYYISELPSQLIWSDVLKITFMSLGFSFLATLYPSWRASQVQPAEALRYE